MSPDRRPQPESRRIAVAADPRKLTLAVLTAGTLVVTLLPNGRVSAAEHAGAQPGPAKASRLWRDCPTEEVPNRQCASVKVPRDYDNPGKGSFRIAMAKIPATGAPGERIGTLFWDAGGPGGPSTAMVDQIVGRVSPEVRRQFDFVAFDPRGIGSSTPVLTAAECPGPWPVRPARNTEPNWFKVQRNSAGVLAPDNRQCLTENRTFMDAMGTNNVVRDLNKLRKAVGDDKLTFWGTSYGTRIGYLYALKYPNRVRALLLDGNIDPFSDFADLAVDGGLAQDSALRFMRNNYRSGYDAIMSTARMLADKPIPLDDGTVFSRWDWLDLAGDQIPFQVAWPSYQELATKVPLAYGSDDVAQQVRAQLAEIKNRSNSNEGGGFSTVNCLDYADRPSARDQGQIITDNVDVAPVFGGSLSTMYAIGCAGLAGLHPDPVPTLTSDAHRARVADVPVLLANATHDGATPLVWAKRMRKAFGGPPLIKYKSGQHVIWGAVDSPCVNNPMDRFILTRKLPKQGRTCPFVPPVPSPTASVQLGN